MPLYIFIKFQRKNQKFDFPAKYTAKMLRNKILYFKEFYEYAGDHVSKKLYLVFINEKCY